MYNEKHDPIEETEEYLAIRDELEKKLEVYRAQYLMEQKKAYEEIGIMFPVSHRMWLEKKRILLEDYGIEWKTPGEMNPHIIYD